MVSEDRIREQLGNVLENTDVPELGDVIHGKVRDSYKWGEKRILVVTDRISAFDCVLGTIPFKGQVLNQMAAFWFEQTRDIVPNHVIDVPDANIMVVRECEQLPVEFVVRGYITGVTKTSAWYSYEQGVRTMCGNVLPDGLRKDQELPEPILTPTTKHEKHDRNVSRREAIDEGLIDAETFDAAADICFRLYAAGRELAARQGLIFVDTKYEIGRVDGALVVSDEVNTPDSSRYWYRDDYEKALSDGRNPSSIDKEYVRLWLGEQGYKGEGPPPALPIDVRCEASRRYIEAYELISGKPFEPDLEEPIARIKRNLGVG